MHEKKKNAEAYLGLVAFDLFLVNNKTGMKKCAGN